MPNTRSAEKALRQSKKKQEHNLFWKRRIKSAQKGVDSLIKENNPDVGILKERVSILQKLVDKAVKEKVIHKNKAKRIKSAYAKKVLPAGKEKQEATKKKTVHEKKLSKSKSKSS